MRSWSQPNLRQSRKTFKQRVEVATLDPFRGYKNAIDDKLADATAVLDAFHVVALAGRAVDEVRRRVQRLANHLYKYFLYYII